MVKVVYQAKSKAYPNKFFLQDKDQEVVGSIEYRYFGHTLVVYVSSAVNGKSISSEFQLSSVGPEDILEMMHSVGLEDGTKESVDE